MDLLGADARRCTPQGRGPGLDGRIVLDHGDAEHLDLAPASVDVATVAFGVRNFGDLDLGLRELARAVKPGGRS